jgi:hypothetical protein
MMVNLSIHRNEDKLRDTKAKLEERRLSVVVARCLSSAGDGAGGFKVGGGCEGGGV